MKKSQHIFTAGIIIFLSLLFNPLKAQYIIQQVEQSIPVSYDWISEGVEFDSFQEEALYFLNLSTEKLLQAANETGESVEKTTSTVYIKGNKLSVEMNGSEGQFTFISDTDREKIYNIMWDQQMVVEITKQDMQQLQEDVNAATEAMLENLPPDIQEQARSAMMAEQNKPTIKANPTNKKLKVSGFDCEQYLIETDEYSTMIWASSDRLNITGKVQHVTEQLNTIFQSEDEDQNEWDLVPGLLPIEVRTFRFSTTGNPTINVETITKIEQANPPSNTFVVPAEAASFARYSMKEFMEEMMKSMQGQ